MRRRLLAAAALLATAATLAFLALPLVAIFSRIPPGRLLSQLDDRVVVDALAVSLKTNVVAEVLIVLLGTPAAYVIAASRFPGRAVLLTLVELPLVLPPAVAGIGLLAAFGRFGLLGSTLRAVGVEVPFTQAAVVLAIAFVASPFYVRTAVAAFESVDRNLLDAARTLGAGPARRFFRIALPLAAGGLGAGAALAFARGLGEFGATIIFAGSLQGLTQTLPLAIYAEFESDFDSALAIGALLVVISAAILLALKLRLPWARFGSRSLFPAVPSSSS